MDQGCIALKIMGDLLQRLMLSNARKKFVEVFFPLRIKAALVVLVFFCLVPLATVSYLFVESIVIHQDQEADRLNLSEAQNFSFKLDAKFRAIEQNLYKLRNFQSLKDGDLARFHAEASEFLRNKDQAGAVLVDHTGKVVLSTLWPYGAPLARLAVDGYQGTFKEPKPSISGLFVGPIDGQWMMVVRVPVWGKNGEVLYSLSGLYTAKQLEGFLKQKTIPPNGIASLIDPSGRVAARTKNPQNSVGQSITPLLKKQLESNTSGVFDGGTREGEPARIAYARSEASGWIVTILTPNAFLLAQKRNALLPYLIGIGASLFFALIVIAWVGGAISSSIKKLAMLAQYIGVQKSVKPFEGLISEINAVSLSIANASLNLKDARYRSYHDPLTGLSNRALLDITLEKQVAQARRMGFPFSLLYMDLDGFKLVNDTYGHAVGDQLLQEFAKRVKGLIRDSDTMARLGGDEFVILLVDANAEKAKILAQKILDSISATPFDLDGATCKIGCSIGLAVYPSDADDAHGLSRKADQALYAAKRAGKNQVYEAAML